MEKRSDSFWNELNGLAAKCNFGRITESLLKDVFIYMSNEDVQQKLSTKPKTTVAETIQFAIAYEEGTIRQHSFDQLEKPQTEIEVNSKNKVNPKKDGDHRRKVSDVKEYLHPNI